MQKVLLIGSSYSTVPILSCLKKKGLHVTVCGSIESDPAHYYADKSLHIDYGEYELLKSRVTQESFNYIIPSCNDISYLACSKLAAEFGYSGFDSPDTVKVIHDKAAYRNFTRQHDLPAPKAIVIRPQSHLKNIDLSFPVLVKPSDAFSGRGMKLVDEKGNLAAALEHAFRESKSKVVLIEEFKAGTLHSHSAFIKRQSILSDFFVDEYCSVYPFQVDCSNHPSRLSDSIKNIVRKSINKIAKILAIQDGLLHTQFLADGDSVWLIESMRRCPGDLYHKLVEISTGFPYIESYVDHFIGKSELPTRDLCTQKPVARHTISQPSDVSFLSLSETIPATKVHIVPLATSGQNVRSAPFGKIAILFAEFKDDNSMWTVTQNMAKFIQLETLEQQCNSHV